MSNFLKEITSVLYGVEKLASNTEASSEVSKASEEETFEEKAFEKISHDEAEYLKNRLRTFGVYIESTEGITKAAFDIFEELLNKISRINENEIVATTEKVSYDLIEQNPLRAFCLGMYNKY